MHSNVRRIKGLEETINKYAHTLNLRSQQLELMIKQNDTIKSAHNKDVLSTYQLHQNELSNLRGLLDMQGEIVEEHRSENEGLKYTLEQLRIKCEVYENDAIHEQPLGYAIHEPSETPSVRWVTWSNFWGYASRTRRELGELSREIDGLNKELEEQHVGRP